jgi:hypothetical protein
MFDEFFQQAFSDEGDDNRGRVYNFIEITEEVTSKNFHLAGRYTGSTITAHRRSN